jgi:hypothetical protein
MQTVPHEKGGQPPLEAFNLMFMFMVERDVKPRGGINQTHEPFVTHQLSSLFFCPSLTHCPIDNLLANFVTEVGDGLAELHAALLKLEQAPGDTETLWLVFHVVQIHRSRR